MKARILFFCSLFAAIALLGGPLAQAAEIHVFAAASLTDALTEIAAKFKAQSGHTLEFNFAASSVLARQIAEGAPADVFFSADEAKMDTLLAKQLVIPESRVSLLGNRLVIVAPLEGTLKISSPRDLLQDSVKMIAIGEPTTVPAGIYTKEYLEKLGIWEELQPKLVPTENVRAALAAVEGGNTQVGIVYKTDALISKKVKILFEVPIQEGPRISYPVAIVKATEQPKAAQEFISFLQTKSAQESFEKFGFSLAGPAVK